MFVFPPILRVTNRLLNKDPFGFGFSEAFVITKRLRSPSSGSGNHPSISALPSHEFLTYTSSSKSGREDATTVPTCYRQEDCIFQLSQRPDASLSFRPRRVLQIPHLCLSLESSNGSQERQSNAKWIPSKSSRPQTHTYLLRLPIPLQTPQPERSIRCLADCDGRRRSSCLSRTVPRQLLFVSTGRRAISASYRRYHRIPCPHLHYQ